MARDPATVAAKWHARWQASEPEFVDGVNRVATSPMEKAANAKRSWVAALQAVFASTKWEDALRRVTLADWKSITIRKGRLAMQAGSPEGQEKQRRFHTLWGPYMDRLKSMLDTSFPRGSPAANERRALEAIRWNRAFRQQAGTTIPTMPGAGF